VLEYNLTGSQRRPGSYSFVGGNELNPPVLCHWLSLEGEIRSGFSTDSNCVLESHLAGTL